ncbi:MAG: DegV family protein [Oscillospiraceae bacterium]|nr:DegV family protein [Oscillospiraceae bacterium]
MKIRIVADSSANIHAFDDMEVTYVPLKILTDVKEYVDDAYFDVAAMLNDLRECKNKSSTACPGVNDWLDAFGDADIVLGVAITSNLSGCYNSARLAGEGGMLIGFEG